jgi:acyl carrier protein
MAPKVAGSWHLHDLTRGHPLDFFVLFSSGAALLGSPGQSNYAAANAFMDSLASLRQAQGRHALSINWGSWSDVGMAALVSEQHRRRWADQGLRMIRPEEGVRMLFDALFGSRAAQVAALPLDRALLPRSGSPFYQQLLPSEAPRRAQDESSSSALPQRLLHAAAAERAALLLEFLTDQLVRVLAVERRTRFRGDQRVIDLGLDSLMAMELRNRVQSALKVRLSVADLLAGQTLDELAASILTALNPSGPPSVEASAQDASASWEEGSL